MWAKLKELVRHYEKVTEQLADPEVLANPDEYQKLARKHGELSETVGLYEEYITLQDELNQCHALLADETDAEGRAWLESEAAEYGQRLDKLEAQLAELLTPRDPRDKRNVILEIRAGAGGEEASLFAGELFRMYARFAERAGWRWEALSLQETHRGGVREAILSIIGQGAFSQLKFESGVHRVQRVPVTESSGRIHTSTATVAVLPEVDEVDVQIRPDEIQIDTYRASGPGGQHVNKTESAIRITHLPTGTVVTCQDEKSQHKNRERALKVLRARIFDQLQAEQEAKTAAQRRQQVGSGDRSERIRTYNFPQGRVTDHRIGLTLHQLEEVLDGDLTEFITALSQAADGVKVASTPN